MTSLSRSTLIGALALAASACVVPMRALRHFDPLRPPRPPVPGPAVIPRVVAPPVPRATAFISEPVVDPEPAPVVYVAPVSVVAPTSVAVAGPTSMTIVAQVPDVVVEQGPGGPGEQSVTFHSGSQTMQVTVPVPQFTVQVNGVMPPPRPECDTFNPCPNAYYWDEERAVYVYYDGNRYWDALGTPDTYPLPSRGVYVTYPPRSYVAPTTYRFPVGRFRPPGYYRSPPANWHTARQAGPSGFQPAGGPQPAERRGGFEQRQPAVMPPPREYRGDPQGHQQRLPNARGGGVRERQPASAPSAADTRGAGEHGQRQGPSRDSASSQTGASSADGPPRPAPPSPRGGRPEGERDGASR